MKSITCTQEPRRKIRANMSYIFQISNHTVVGHGIIQML
jgi:hypothetical protein